MKILVAGDDVAFNGLVDLLAERPEFEVLNVGQPGESAFALVWLGSVDDAGEITRLVDAGWRVFAVSRGDLRETRAVALNAGAEDVADDPPSLEWIEACAESVSPAKKRRELRYVANVPWSLRRQDGPPFDGNLVNVSRGGFKVLLADPPAVGEVLVAMFAKETGVPPLYARVLSATTASPSGWWIRARFVALRKDEGTKLDGWLETLKREDVDPVKALISIDAMTARDLRKETSAFGGVRLPPLLALEKSWAAASEASPEHALSLITLARARATMVASVLSSSPSLAFDPPIDRWRAELTKAAALASDPATLSQAVGDVTAEPAAAREFTEIQDRLGVAFDAFERATAKFADSKERRTASEMSSLSAAPLPRAPDPGVTAPAAAPAGAPARGVVPGAATSGGGSGPKTRTAVSIAAAALAPKEKPPSSPALKGSRTTMMAIVAGAVVVFVLGLWLAIGGGGGGSTKVPAVFEASGVRVSEFQHAGNPIAIVDESWAKASEETRRSAAAAIAKKAGKGTVVIRNASGRNLAIVTPDGKVALVGE